MAKRNSIILILVSLMVHMFMSVPQVAADPCGTVDQSYTEPFDPEFWGDLLSAAPIGQSFTPSQPYLNCVDVLLANGAREARVYLFVRQGSITGPILNTGQVPYVTIPKGMTASWVKIRLCYPVKVTPGQRYVIELVASDEAVTTVGWMAGCPGCPDYPRGEAIRGGSAVPWDYNFRTYYKPQASEAEVIMTDYWASSDEAGLDRISVVGRGDRFYVHIEYRVQDVHPAGAVFWPRTLASVNRELTRHKHHCSTDATTGGDKYEFTIPPDWTTGLKIIFVVVWLESHESLYNMVIKAIPLYVTPSGATNGEQPEEFALLPNFVNPFNPETWIPYKLAEDVETKIRIYNVSGHLIRTLNLGHQSSGLYITKDKAAYWDGRDNFGNQVASGVYFYTLQAGDFTATRKMVIRK